MAAVDEAARRLKKAQELKRRRNMGEPLDVSDAELERLSEITETDIALAQSHARKNGSSVFNDLLRATEDDDG